MISRQHLAFLAAALAALLVAPALLKTYGLYLLTLWLVYVIAALGLNLTVGYAGLKSLCHAGFMGVGVPMAIDLHDGLVMLIEPGP